MLRRLFMILVVVIVVGVNCVSYAQSLPSDAYDEFNLLWDIPFGLPVEETVRVFKEKLGIDLQANQSSDDLIKLTPYTNSEFRFLNYPVDVSVNCFKDITINDHRYSMQQHVCSAILVAFKNILSNNGDTNYISDGFNQLRDIMMEFSSKYGDPTLMYCSCSKDISSRAETYLVDMDFFTEENMKKLSSEGWYYVGIEVCFNNIGVFTFFTESNWKTTIIAGTISSEITMEDLKESLE